MFMRFNLNLDYKYFLRIKNKQKDVEMRLYNKNRKDIKIGDEILFSNKIDDDTILVDVVGLKRFKNFDELYAYYPKTRLGYFVDEISKPSDMNEFYSDEDITKYGVIAIEIAKKDI